MTSKEEAIRLVLFDVRQEGGLSGNLRQIQRSAQKLTTDRVTLADVRHVRAQEPKVQIGRKYLSRFKRVPFYASKHGACVAADTGFLPEMTAVPSYILFVDVFSRLGFVYACKQAHVNADAVVEALDAFIAAHYTPKSFVSDQG